MAFTAKQAIQAEAREAKRLQREQAKQARADRAEDLKDCRWAMKNVYPKDLKEIKEEIQRQVKFCAANYHAMREVTFALPHGARYHAYKKQLAKDLQGFEFYETHVPASTENMGDFNAPCNVEVPSYWLLHITWKK